MRTRLQTQISNPAATDPVTSPRFISNTQIPAEILPPAPPGGFPQSLPPDSFPITAGVDDQLQAPYTMNTDFTIQREFSLGFILQASYVGRFSRKSLQGDDVAAPTDLADPKSGMDYFTAASLMQQYVRAQQNLSAPNPAVVKPIFNIDMGVFKRFIMPFSEKQSLQIRAEGFNITNTPNFDTYTASLSLGSQGSFGKYSSLLNTPRVFQFAMRYEF